MDGVPIEAVEGYKNPNTNEVGLTTGVFPFNPYYSGFAVSGSYTRYFSESLGWEVVHVTGSFNVQKNLTAELAEVYGVNPERIEKLSVILTTHAKWVFLYGKAALLKRVIQYYRASLLGGGGLVTTTVESRLGFSMGVAFDGYLGPSLSWKLEIRNFIAVPRVTNFVSFGVGIGLSF